LLLEDPMARKLKRHLLDVRMYTVFERLQTRCGKASPHEKNALRVALKSWDDAVDLEPKTGYPYCRSCERSWGKDNGREEVDASGLKEVPGAPG
jgi:hypothetical protein